MEPLAGDDPVRVAGYQVRARLGAGGMGRVYLAFTAGGRPVALKVIRPELGDDPDFRRRFRQEVEAARRVHGLYTAQVLDADLEATPPWLVTAYVPGPSLQQAVSDHGPLPAGTALLLMAGVAEALQAVHAAGLVHRDLKPSNVLLAPDGPRVIDFGIARAAEATTVTRTGMRVGSPPYMAPEQVQGTAVTAATDVFALGSVTAFAVTGQLPFGAGHEQAMLYRVVHTEPDLSGCPEALRPLIARCLAKAPADRPSPAEIIEECRAGTAGQTLQIAQSWLPAALAADLAQHVPPVQPIPTADVSGSGSGPGGPPPGAVPPQPWPAAPPGQAATAAGGPRRVPQRLLIAALVVVAVAGVGAALALSLSSGGGGGSPVTTDGTHASSPAAASAAATSSRSPTASEPVDPAVCVTGAWRAVNQQLISNIDGQQTVFTGSGAETTYRADGTVTTVYDHVVFRATVNGVAWTEVVQGTSTGHWAIASDQILYSSITSTGSETLYADGIVNNSGPLESLPGAVPYQCSGNTLRESFPLTGGSVQATRITHP